MKFFSASLILLSVITLAPVSSHAGEPVRIQIVDSIPMLDTFSRKIQVVSASASSTGGAGSAAAAADNLLSTRWESQFNVDPTTLTLDLGAAYSLSQVVIYWEAANAATYKIEGSNNFH